MIGLGSASLFNEFRRGSRLPYGPRLGVEHAITGGRSSHQLIRINRLHTEDRPIIFFVLEYYDPETPNGENNRACILLQGCTWA
jgi:hypothetical protein